MALTEFEFDEELCNAWHEEQRRLKAHHADLMRKGAQALIQRPLVFPGNLEETMLAEKLRTRQRLKELEGLLKQCSEAYWDMIEEESLEYEVMEGGEHE